MLLFLALNNFAQKAEYTINAGANYNFFTMKSVNQENQQNFSSNSDYTYFTISTYEIEIESDGATGFFIDNAFLFPVNKHIYFKTGFGISINNVDIITKTKSTYQNNSVYPFFVDTTHIIVVDTNRIVPYTNEYVTGKDYNIFLLNIPIQIQVKLLKEKLNLDGGLLISAVMQAKNTFSTNTGSYTHIATNNFENMFFSVHLGVSYNIFDNIYAGVKYDYSVTDVFKSSNSQLNYSQNYYKTHLNNVSLNLSYKF